MILATCPASSIQELEFATTQTQAAYVREAYVARSTHARHGASMVSRSSLTGV
jgi:hypothetical protein